MTESVSAIAAVLALGVAAIVYWGQRYQSHMEIARLLHLDLTSGEVAMARELLGTLRYGNEAARAQIDPAASLTAYFTLLWCFERIRAGRVCLLSGLGRLGRPRAVRYLDDLLQWHLVEWQAGLPIVRQRIGERIGSPVDDGQSALAFERLLIEHGSGRVQRGSRSAGRPRESARPRLENDCVQPAGRVELL
ncbi:hypothetical protein [Blastococcus montanus]|uniref:hypothetical protein n=1 Tax=Blastococcus montanus TaxID=3144973 RepID=UPI0032078D1A